MSSQRAQGVRERPTRRSVVRLHPATAPRTVRVQDGTTLPSEGPSVDTNDALDGYTLTRRTTAARRSSALRAFPPRGWVAPWRSARCSRGCNSEHQAPPVSRHRPGSKGEAMQAWEKIAVAGATGPVGRHVVGVLTERGRHRRHLTLQRRRRDRRGLSGALAGARCVIDTATGQSLHLTTCL